MERSASEWGPGLHEDGFGITPDDDVNTVDGFRAWVARIEGARLSGGGSSKMGSPRRGSRYVLLMTSACSASVTSGTGSVPLHAGEV